MFSSFLNIQLQYIYIYENEKKNLVKFYVFIQNDDKFKKEREKI